MTSRGHLLGSCALVRLPRDRSGPHARAFRKSGAMLIGDGRASGEVCNT